jgi:hypothetical protein
MKGVTMEEAEAAIWEELHRFANDLISEEELTKIKNKIEANQVFSRMPILNKAMNLGYFEMLGDAKEWNTEIEKYQSITRDDLSEQVSTMLGESKKNTLYYNAQLK